jgi:hypothetical protein
MEGWLYLLFGFAIAGLIFYRANFSPEAKAQALTRAEAQKLIICQYCQQAGGVTVRNIQQKQGVSGGKATSALLTGGVSLFAVGLSKKGMVNELTCSKCSMKWHAV